MAKDPAFLFYPGDWLGGTLGMTFEEKGAYMELLMMQFNRGHMDGHMCGQLVGQLWDKLRTKFIQDDKGLWYNERLEIESNKRKSFTDSRKNNLLGNNQYNKKLGHKGGHTTSRMENENENENEVKNVIEYLNARAGTNFRANTDKAIKHIRARINEKFTHQDFVDVIDNRVDKWANDPKMKEYLRPETLFGTKFESYLNDSKTRTLTPLEQLDIAVSQSLNSLRLEHGTD